MLAACSKTLTSIRGPQLVEDVNVDQRVCESFLQECMFQVFVRFNEPELLGLLHFILLLVAFYDVVSFLVFFP